MLLAAVGNVLGPLLLGKAVANTIAGIVTVPTSEVIPVLGAALTGAVAVERDHLVAGPAVELRRTRCSAAWSVPRSPREGPTP